VILELNSIDSENNSTSAKGSKVTEELALENEESEDEFPDCHLLNY